MKLLDYLYLGCTYILTLLLFFFNALPLPLGFNGWDSSSNSNPFMGPLKNNCQEISNVESAFMNEKILYFIRKLLLISFFLPTIDRLSFLVISAFPIHLRNPEGRPFQIGQYFGLITSNVFLKIWVSLSLDSIFVFRYSFYFPILYFDGFSFYKQCFCPVVLSVLHRSGCFVGPIVLLLAPHIQSRDMEREGGISSTDLILVVVALQ